MEEKTNLDNRSEITGYTKLLEQNGLALYKSNEPMWWEEFHERHEKKRKAQEKSFRIFLILEILVMFILGFISII